MYENHTLSCAFTGHRNAEYSNAVREPVSGNLHSAIELLLKEGFAEFYCGMAQGFDLMAAEELLTFRGKYDFRLIAVKPCADQSDTFTHKNRRRHDEILKRCDEVTVLSENYYKGCMQARDRYMVDRSDALICYLRKNSGGTFYTVQYAKKKGKRIIEL